MAITQSDLDTAVQAWASGALRVDYPNGGAVTYRSQADLEAAITTMSAALGASNPLAASATAPARFSFAQHSRG